MIGGNLYPIYQSIATGFLSTDEYMQEISTNVNGNNYSDKMSGYYLGWARPQNLPDPWKFTRPHAVTYAFSDADYGRLDDYRDLPRLSLNPIGNAEQNSDIGYAMSPAFSDTGSYWNTYSSENAQGNKETGEHDDFGSNSNAVNNLSYTFGINNIYPEFWGVSTVRLRFLVFFSNPLNEPLEVKNDFTIDNMTIPQYRLFKIGSLSYTYNGAYGNVTITGTDFVDGKANVETSIGNKAIVIFTGVLWQNAYFYRGSEWQTTWVPGVLIHDKTVFNFFGSAINTGDERFVAYNSAGYENAAPYYLNNLAGAGVSYTGNGYTVGCGKELDLTIGDIIDIPTNHWTEQFDGFIIQRGNSGVASGIWIYPYYDISMVEKVLGFLPKVMQINSVPSYANLNYAPLVSASDEFMGSMHTGNTNDPAFTSKLRRWQYIDPENPDPENNGTANANTYDATDPDSKPDFDPDYDPSGGGGEEGGKDPEEDPEQLDPGDIEPGSLQDSGDVPFNTAIPSSPNNGFVTLYALTAAEVDALGNNLWSTLRNPSSPNFIDMIRNFYTIGDNLDPTYYLTNADIIDYFISLRYYPFNIGRYPGLSEPTPVKVGSGACPLGANGRILNKNLVYIPGGSCSIPEATGFYDYEPYVSIVAYIPFCGTVELQPSQVRGKTLKLDYYVDFTTGSCTAYIKVKFDQNTFPIDTVNGTLGFDILMTSNNANTVAARTQASNNNTRINMIETLGGGIMSGVTGLITAGKTRGGEGEILKEAAKDVGKSIFDAGMQSIKHVTNQPLLMGLSPMTSGSFSSMSALGYVTPFIQIKYHPQFNRGANYSMVGYVANKKMQLSNIKSGTFFTCINPQLKGIKCTAREAEMIKAHLTAGCYK